MIFCVLLASFVPWEVISQELILVQTVFRHGDRAPMGDFTSPESESYYFRGRQHLTNVMFRSSASARCLMTASTAASAMFNETESGLSTPIPIFTEPKEKDYVCVPRIQCPFVMDDMRTVLKVTNKSYGIEDLLQELFRQEAKVLNFTRVVGKRLRKFEPLFLEHESGMPVPKWFDDRARKEADHLLDLHDATISSLLESFGVMKEALAPQGRPDFTSAVTFELYRNGTEYSVKVLYRSGVIRDDFVDISGKIKKCAGMEACPLDVLTKSVAEFQTDNPESLCEVTELKKIVAEFQPLTMVFMFTTVISTILFLSALFLLMRYRTTLEKDSKLHHTRI
ncbi:unnamed protein product [Nippostrongylus brasiliensis]|uniref:acid phosphatase n=1 Tax=Nippostrongylus brasiliensis TaxID=27835 RepID=A0A158QZX2_NIPBR|nr:unnamed protein product [Nippostrongylus brasiliensis]